MLHKLEADPRITWIASYPKSGNTWLRMLLEAYRCGGYVNINDLHTVAGDSAAAYTSAVSAVELDELSVALKWQLRPAALLNALMCKSMPRLFKTHFANLKQPGVPAFIPWELTQRAVYIIRDPRDVAVSFSKYFDASMELTCKALGSTDHYIGEPGGKTQMPQMVSSWSNHVASWGAEEKYPVHFVKYEDMMADPSAALRSIVEFLEWPVDDDLIARSVEACSLAKARKHEEEHGFAEGGESYRGGFFNEGGSRWEDELAPKWARQIEADHGNIMSKFGYLDNVVELKEAT